MLLALLQGQRLPSCDSVCRYGQSRYERHFLKEITKMRSMTSLFAAVLLACSMSAIAADNRGTSKATDGSIGDIAAAEDRGTGTATDGRSGDLATKNEGSVVRDGTRVAEYGNECAWGLANGKHVQTNCSINMTGSDGKTYCFSNDKAMAAFMKDAPRNLSKAKETYGRS